MYILLPCVLSAPGMTLSPSFNQVNYSFKTIFYRSGFTAMKEHFF
jgi:hypothetical protein